MEIDANNGLRAAKQKRVNVATTQFIDSLRKVLINRTRIISILEEYLGLPEENLVFDHCHFRCSSADALQAITKFLTDAGFILVDLPTQFAEKVAVFSVPDSNISLAIDKSQAGTAGLTTNYGLVLDHLGFIPKLPADYKNLAGKIKPEDIIETTKHPLPKILILLISLTPYFSGKVEILEESPLVKLTQHQT